MAMVSYNDGDEKKFIETWEKKVDSISVNKVHTYGDAVSDISGTNKINFNKFTYPCKYLWNTIVVGVTGDVLLCCLDYEASYVFGNIKNSKILDILYSPKFEAVRRMHVQNNIKNFSICAKCYTPYKNGVEWFVRDLY